MLEAVRAIAAQLQRGLLDRRGPGPIDRDRGADLFRQAGDPTAFIADEVRVQMTVVAPIGERVAVYPLGAADHGGEPRVPEFHQVSVDGGGAAVGLAEVRDVFRVAKMGAVAGCRVIEGEVRRNLPVRVLRDNVVIFDGQIDSLKRFKDDVTEVKSGFECGIGVKNYNDIKPGDQIEIYQNVEQAATL